jgi:ABC-type amino acid transport substrate-binding protein
MLHRQLLRGFLTSLLALFILGCTTTSNSGSTPTIDRVLVSQTLRVGMSADQPPFNMINKDDKVMGMDVDIAKTIAQAMDVNLKIVRKPFSELLPAVNSGEVDMVMSGVSINLARSKHFTFIGPYLMSGKSILTKASTLARVERAQDINSRDVHLVALAGSTSEDFVRKHLPKAKLTTIRDYEEGIELLADDRAHALIADMPVCILGTLLYPEQNFVALEQPFNLEPIGIAVAKEDQQFAHLINNYLITLDKSGLLDVIRTRWLKKSDWIKQMKQAPKMKPGKRDDYQKYKDL